MLSLSPCPNVSKFKFSSQGKSSTRIDRGRSARFGFGPCKWRKTGEVSFLSGDCPGLVAASRNMAMGERNESVLGVCRAIGFSNRKDRQKARHAPLLKTPNPSPMNAFTECPSHRSSAPEEQVMDRGTEGAAGGSDAL